jgi:hypothetical protein
MTHAWGVCLISILVANRRTSSEGNVAYSAFGVCMEVVAHQRDLLGFGKHPVKPFAHARKICFLLCAITRHLRSPAAGWQIIITSAAPQRSYSQSSRQGCSGLSSLF